MSLISLRTTKEKNEVDVIDDNYNIFFEVGKNKLCLAIDRFLHKNQKITLAYLEVNPDNKFYFTQTPREVVAIISEIYKKYKFYGGQDFLNFLSKRFPSEVKYDSLESCKT